jgi:hypothetical protein
MEEAGKITKAVAALLRTGNIEEAFTMALDLEPILSDVDRALQTAAYLRRVAEA